MSTQETPTAILRDQHRNILKVAAVLDQVLGDGSEAHEIDYDAVADCISFIRLYADALHHGKEEDLLFPALQERGMPKDAGPIAVMLHEHKLGRQFVKTMVEHLPRAREGDGAARKRLAEAGGGYVELIRGHIMKEDHILFGMADQMIDAPACRSLCAAYDGVCQRRFDGCTVAELEAILTRLETRYPVGQPGA
jgi:hemerythrin-like domain-containing protein